MEISTRVIELSEYARTAAQWTDDQLLAAIKGSESLIRHNEKHGSPVVRNLKQDLRVLVRERDQRVITH